MLQYRQKGTNQEHAHTPERFSHILDELLSVFDIFYTLKIKDVFIRL